MPPLISSNVTASKMVKPREPSDDFISSDDIRGLRNLRQLLINMSETNLGRGGNGLTFPDEIILLGRTINHLESTL